MGERERDEGRMGEHGEMERENEGKKGGEMGK